jgi:hypothetical protein
LEESSCDGVFRVKGAFLHELADMHANPIGETPGIQQQPGEAQSALENTKENTKHHSLEHKFTEDLLQHMFNSFLSDKEQSLFEKKTDQNDLPQAIKDVKLVSLTESGINSWE